MKEQIEEMAIDIGEKQVCGWVFVDNSEYTTDVFNKELAEHLVVNKGYRKQSEGEWVAKDNFNGRCSIATCSNCGTEKAFSILVRTETIATLYPYCQKCGAKMKGGAE